MSEQSRHKPEQSQESHESLINHEQQRRNQEQAVENARKALAEHRAKDTAELAKEAAKHASETKKDLAEKSTTEQRNYDDVPGLQQSMKNRAYKRELTKIRAKLPTASKRFSKVIHHPTVETISNVGAQTIARPSGLLGGSIAAFIGSLILYYMARQYGFRYNYLVMFLLFVAGFAVGAFIELLTYRFKPRTKHSTK
jgi:hypothetical protein